MNMMIMMMMMKRGIFSKIIPSSGDIKRTIINPEVTLQGAA
jgi:hypothetical protein